MTFTPIKIMTQNEIDRGVERDSIEIEYKTRWAEDEKGIARPVGSYEIYKDRKTGATILGTAKCRI